MKTDLVPKQITPKDVFVPNGLESIIAGVEKKLKDEKAKPFDVNNKTDREKRSSFAYQISRSKTFVDDKGKDYVGEIKKKTKEIDAERKRFRDKMDSFRDDAKLPVVQWENAEKIKQDEERLRIEKELEAEEAARLKDIEDREKELARKESEMAKAEADQKAKEQAEQAEKERLENETRIKKEAEEKATKDAELKVVAEREAKEQAEQDLKHAEENAKQAKLQAIEDAKEAELQVERDRVAAEEKAKEDQEAAVQKAKDDAAAKENERQYIKDLESQREREKAQEKSENKRHQASVNNKIKAGLIAIGLDEETAVKVIIAVAKNEIPLLKILY